MIEEEEPGVTDFGIDVGGGDRGRLAFAVMEMSSVSFVIEEEEPGVMEFGTDTGGGDDGEILLSGAFRVIAIAV